MDMKHAPLILIIASCSIAVMYYATHRDTLQVTKYEPLAVEEREIEQDANIVEQKEVETKLEIAFPEYITFTISDAQGRQTGKSAAAGGMVVNDIPRSDYTPGKARPGDMEDQDNLHWITLLRPDAGIYTLRASGAKEGDSIILYGTNTAGAVSTELVPAQSVISFEFDPSSEISSLILQ